MDRDKTAYFIADTTQPAFDTLVARLTNVHRQAWPKNDLAVRFTRDLKEAMIKVSGVALGDVSDALITRKIQDSPRALMRQTKWDRRR